MKKLICLLKGHSWAVFKSRRTCTRCGDRQTIQNNKWVKYTVLLLVMSVSASAQQKPDTAKYHLTEQQAILLSNILNSADIIAGNSTTVSTAQYRELHAQIVKLDSVIRRQYFLLHPAKEAAKNGKP